MIPELIVYLLKVNLALLIFYAGYRFVLQRYTFHTLNRFYLLIGLIYSALYPLINLSEILNRNQQLKEQISLLATDWQGSVIYVVSGAESGAGYYWQIVLLIFWTGVIVMTLRLIIQLISLINLHIKSTTSTLGNTKFRRISEAVNPFSFWRTIYLNPECHEASELPSILEHERIHINQLHTLDVMLAEISTIFYWFNPGVWLMKKTIKANLEFITDQEVIRSGIDSRDYQYTLLRSQVLPQNSMPINNFHFLTIKKRIAMINKKPSNRINLSNYLLLLPAIMLLVLVTGISKAEFTASDVVENITGLTEVSPLSFILKDESESIKPLKDVDLETDQNQLIDRQKKILAHTSVLDTNKKGSEKIVEVAKTPSVVIMRSSAGIDTAAGSQPLYVVDGQRMQKKDLQMKPDKIESINVLKGEGAVSKYGKDGKNGVIEIRTKTVGTGKSSSSLEPVTVIGYGSNQNQKITLSDIENQLIILDGKEITKAMLDDLQVTSIGSVEVFKGSSGVNKYGEKGKNGVIVVTTKKK